MRLLCKLGRHNALPSTLWNDGHFFSRCVHCDCDMIRTADTAWRAVPRNYVVIWRAPEPVPKRTRRKSWPNGMAARKIERQAKTARRGPRRGASSH